MFVTYSGVGVVPNEAIISVFREKKKKTPPDKLAFKFFSFFREETKI